MDTNNLQILESDRLYFRNFIPEDCEEMFLLNADWDVLKYTGDEIFNTIAEARTFFENYQLEVYDKVGYGRMTTILKETDEVIGWSGMKFHPENNEVDLGYRFHKRFWNKGYGTEAAIACLKYAYETLKLETVVAYADKKNIGSCRVLEKSGFTNKGMKEHYGKMWQYYELKLPLDLNSLL